MEDIGDVATIWRIKGSSCIIFYQAKSYGLSSPYILTNVPLCGNMYFTSLYCKLLAPLHALVLYQVCVCMCCALHAYLVYSSMFVWDIIYLCVFALSLMHLDDILFGSFGVINGSSHFGGVICLGISLSLKCVYMSTTT